MMILCTRKNLKESIVLNLNIKNCMGSLCMQKDIKKKFLLHNNVQFSIH